MWPMFRNRILVPDLSDEPLRHPQLNDMFERLENGSYRVKLHAN